MNGLRARHRGAVVWLTGLPGAGKTTLATGAAEALKTDGYLVRILDGDVLRRGLNVDLGYSKADRMENVRRVGEVAALFAEADVLCLVAVVSPYRDARARARRRADGVFREVYVDARLDVCEARDPKGMYRRARRGELADFTGISAEYEPPLHPDLAVDTNTQTPERCIATLVDYIRAEFPITL